MIRYRQTESGDFYAADTERNLTSFAPAGTSHARIARRDPEAEAFAILAGENRTFRGDPRNAEAVAAYDARNLAALREGEADGSTKEAGPREMTLRYRLDADGGFLAANLDTRAAAYAFPGTELAERAKADPSGTAYDMTDKAAISREAKQTAGRWTAQDERRLARYIESLDATREADNTRTDKITETRTPLYAERITSPEQLAGILNAATAPEGLRAMETGLEGTRAIPEHEADAAAAAAREAALKTGLADGATKAIPRAPGPEDRDRGRLATALDNDPPELRGTVRLYGMTGAENARTAARGIAQDHDLADALGSTPSARLLRRDTSPDRDR